MGAAAKEGELEPGYRQVVEWYSRQGRFFRPWTLASLREAGVSAGMRVLDAGCGGGDTAAVLLELVGSEGSVVGIDTIPEAVTASQMRFPREQYPNMQFRLLDANRLPFRREFDAVVGRFMLMYAPEPVETAAKLAECLRPGGVITFIEPDYTCVRQREHLPLYRRVQNLIDIALQRIGADTGIGLNLYRILRMAGLSDLEVRCNVAAGGGPNFAGYSLAASLLALCMPTLEQIGTVDVADLNLETIEACLRAEVEETGGVLLLPAVVAAWGKRHQAEAAAPR